LPAEDWLALWLPGVLDEADGSAADASGWLVACKTVTDDTMALPFGS
jgi:hypothetical protein